VDVLWYIVSSFSKTCDKIVLAAKHLDYYFARRIIVSGHCSYIVQSVIGSYLSYKERYREFLKTGYGWMLCVIQEQKKQRLKVHPKNV